jgi:hypothetical protein
VRTNLQMSKNVYGQGTFRASHRSGSAFNPFTHRLSKGLGPTSYYKANKVAQQSLTIHHEVAHEGEVEVALTPEQQRLKEMIRGFSRMADGDTSRRPEFKEYSTAALNFISGDGDPRLFRRFSKVRERQESEYVCTHCFLIVQFHLYDATTQRCTSCQ